LVDKIRQRKSVIEAQSTDDPAIQAAREELNRAMADGDRVIGLAKLDGRQRLDAKKAETDRRRDDKFAEIDRQLAGQIQTVQDRYKMWAVLLPPIPPLL